MISASTDTQPKVLVEYEGPGNANEHDIFFLLRPKSNTCKFESLLFSVLRNSPEYHHTIRLVYLANLPGVFIKKFHIMNHYHENRLFFAKHGKAAFSDVMKRKFEQKFSRNFDKVGIYTPFEAMKYLCISEHELARVWVASDDINYIEGQSICRMIDADGQECFIVNHDIPSLLDEYREGTNSAVFIIRTSLSYAKFKKYIEDIVISIYHSQESLFSKSTIEEDFNLGHPVSEEMFKHGGYKRFFHYSNGPFEQLQDAISFLFDSDGNHVNIEQYTFARYLHQYGDIRYEWIKKMLRCPIGMFDINGTLEEHSLYHKTYNDNFLHALQVLQCLRSQRLTCDDIYA